MTADDIEGQITKLKVLHQAATDAELAKALQIGRSTIASWRLRRSIPLRYIMRKPGDDQSFVSFAIKDWAPEEMAAFRLALLRMTFGKGEFFPTYRDFLTESGFKVSELLHAIKDAKYDILEKLKEYPDMDALSAAQILAYPIYHPDAKI